MRARCLRVSLVLTFTSSLLACASTDSDEDAIDDSFTTGKADAFSVLDGSPAALGSLLIANRSTAAELDAAGLTTTAVTAILDRRPLSTLAELDDVPFVGPITYARIEAAATAHGWTAPSFYQRTGDTWANYTLIPRLDGTLTAVVRGFDNKVSVIVDLGTRLEKRARLSDGFLLPAATRWVEDRAGHLFSAIVPPGSTQLRLVRLTPDALHKDGLPEPGLESILETSAAGTVQTAIGADGTVYMTYGVSGYPSQAGVFVRSCPPAQPCGSPERIATPSFAPSIALAIAVDGLDVVVAVGGATTQVFRGHPGLWMPVAAPTIGADPRGLMFATGQNRLVLVAITAAGNFSQSARFFERTTTGWTPVAVPPDLIADGAIDLRIVRGHGLVVLTERRFQRSALSSMGIAVKLARLLREGDGFVGQEVATQRWLAGRVLATGEVTYVEPTQFTPSSSVGRTRGQPVRWRDASATTGAGSLELGRDPCLFSPSPDDTRLPTDVTTNERGVTILTIQAGTTYTVPAGSCIHLDRFAGDGELVLAGTKARPIHLLGTSLTVRRVRATYAFFDDTPLDFYAGDPDSFAEGFGREGTLDHVSVARAKTVRRAVELPIGWNIAGTLIGLGGSVLPVPRQFVVTSSDFGPIAGDAIALPASTMLTVRDTRFHDLTGTAISLINGGLNDTSLVIERTSMERVNAGVRLLAITERQRVNEILQLRESYPATYSAVIARVGNPVVQLATPVQIDTLAVTGPMTISTTERPQPGVLLQAATGTLVAITVVGAASDGLRLDEPRELEVRGGGFNKNGRHGIAITNEAPPGLGPCYVPPPSLPPPSAPHYPDPAVHNAVIDDNAGAGIYVSGPQIPMTVWGNRVRDNLLPGFVIASGRGVSPSMPDPSCGPGGYRTEQEVDLPLSAISRITGNELVGNGTDDADLQLRSDHRSGTLPVHDNYWGVSTADVPAALRCTATCAHSPARSTPLP